ncbi:MAG: two-component system regulatory protein YycI [Clostridia bacterium]|nr:two-component system regulatory protein YycI [Clostridia bacterium]
MDWVKAKNVLIVVFVVLNIFLTVNLVLFYRADSAHGKNTINAVKILEDRGVGLKCKVPDISTSYRINYENAALDMRAIASLLLGSSGIPSEKLKYGKELTFGVKSIVFNDSSSFTFTDGSPGDKVEINDKDKTIKYCIKFLNSLKLPVTEYCEDRYIKQPDGSVKIAFKEIYKDYIIFSNEFEIEISDRGIRKLKGRLIKVNGEQSKGNNIVPAYQILLRYYTERKSTIVGIDIGFNCEFRPEGISSSTSPVWRIRTGEGSEQYFSTVDGSIIEKKM